MIYTRPEQREAFTRVRVPGYPSEPSRFGSDLVWYAREPFPEEGYSPQGGLSPPLAPGRTYTVDGNCSRWERQG